MSIIIPGIVIGLGYFLFERKSIQAAPTTPKFKPVGLVGCASSNCHGKPADGDLAISTPDSWKTSCGVWSSIDPHTNAFAVLDPEKNAIARRMQTAFQKLEPNYSTQKDARCLACHTNPSLADPAPEVAPPAYLASLRAEGVSCEACHGNAQAWQGPHTSWINPEKRKLGLEATGMPELNEWGSRAKVCAGCHVGAPADPERGYPARDMNHDMIAAGHPRLVFEFSSHLSRLPKHWYERDRGLAGFPARGPEASARAWLLGQVATAEAQCELSADRALRGSQGASRSSEFPKLADPWPELAEFNCYSCHHTLLPSSWRSRPAATAGRIPGRPTWDLPWPTAHLQPEAIAPVMNRLRNAVKPEMVQEQAGELLRLMKSSREQIAAETPEEAQRRVVSLLNVTMAQSLSQGWDDTYRMYLGISAMEFSRQEWLRREKLPLTGQEISRDLQTLAKLLKLPQNPTEAHLKPEEAKKLLQGIVQKFEAEMQPLRK